MGMHEKTGFFSSIAAPPARQPDVVVFNYHSPGPALKFVRAWAKQTRSIDVVIEKPLSLRTFGALLS